MITVEGQSCSREELESKFLHQYCPWAKTWSMERDRRVTHWTSPGGTVRVLVELSRFEYKSHPSDVAGLIGDAIQWDETVLKRHEDGTWRPTALIRLTKKTTKQALARRRAARRSA
jgi:hypothetical protein